MSDKGETSYQRQKRQEFERNLNLLKQEYTKILATRKVDKLRRKMSIKGKRLPLNEEYRLKANYEKQLQPEVEAVFQNPYFINFVKETIAFNRRMKSNSKTSWFFFEECLKLHRQGKVNAQPSWEFYYL